MKSTGRHSISILPSNHLALEIRIRILGTHSEPPGLAFSSESILQAHQLPACVITALTTVLNCGDYHPCCTGKQQHAIQPGNRGTGPRHVSAKPTLGLNLETGSADRCLELVMRGCNDMFTCLSSVGRNRGVMGFFFFFFISFSLDQVLY